MMKSEKSENSLRATCRKQNRWGVAAFYTVTLAYCLWVWSLIFRLLGEMFA